MCVVLCCIVRFLGLTGEAGCGILRACERVRTSLFRRKLGQDKTDISLTRRETMSLKIGRILLVAGVFSALAFQASAQDEQYAYSANAVGVIRKSIPAGKMALLSIPLDDSKSTNAAIPFFELPFLSTLPSRSTVSLWDPANARWLQAKKGVGGKWGGDTNILSTMSVYSGQAVFIENGSSTKDVAITIVGEVPADENIPVALGAGSQMVLCANPYPVAFAFTNSTLALQSKNKANADFWDMEGSQWVSATKGVGGKWRGATNQVVNPAEGFMYTTADSDTNTTWVVTKPYEWPVTVSE